jgi:MinD-like ATPase involved in chromosome partitioning or flagellar assembly
MAGDDGMPVVLDAPNSPVAAAFRDLAGRVAQQASIAAAARRE